MNTGDSTAKLIIALGFIIMITGIIWLVRSKMGLGPFHLPGDIVVKRGNYTFYFPWVTCILISIFASIIFYLAGRK